MAIETLFFPDRHPPSRRAESVAPMASLLAGARARGVADGFAWLGLAAVLIDDRGEALHLNPGAVELMGDALQLSGGRLSARDGRDDAALAEAVRSALQDGRAASARVGAQDGLAGDELVVHVAPMPADPDDSFQRLRAVAFLTRDGGAARHWLRRGRVC